MSKPKKRPRKPRKIAEAYIDEYGRFAVVGLYFRPSEAKRLHRFLGQYLEWLQSKETK